MAFGLARFMYNGWIERLYLEPRLFFKFYGFEWVKVFDATGMYLLFSVTLVSSLFVMLGLFYRGAIVVFFLSFTYIELIDATNYLNHYYLVCLLAFLLIFIPANRAFSLDVWRKPSIQQRFVPAWTIYILIFQLVVVYTFAGIAKLNYDWLVRAMPLSVWLPERTHLPILGYFFQFKWAAYLFSWVGALYDLTIAFFLLNKRTRPLAYLAVIVFHLLTKLLFNIGLFPFIMITSTLIFFPATVHEKWLKKIGYSPVLTTTQYQFSLSNKKIISISLGIYMIIQLALPLRHYLYPGNVLWTEEGYRFAWRVMLVEKNGYAVFTVKDSASSKKTEIINGQFLTLFQEKQMSIQPDFMLQYAHYLKRWAAEKHGFVDPIVTVDAHVALNGRTSQRFIKSDVNLATIKDNLKTKSWIIKQQN